MKLSQVARRATILIELASYTWRDQKGKEQRKVEAIYWIKVSKRKWVPTKGLYRF